MLTDPDQWLPTSGVFAVENIRVDKCALQVGRKLLLLVVHACVRPGLVVIIL